MKEKLNLTFLGLVATLLVWIGFLTPWAKSVGLSLGAPLKIAQHLIINEKNFVNTILIPSKSDIDEIKSEAKQQISGYHLAMFEKNSKDQNRLVKNWLKTFWESRDYDECIQTLWLLPFLGLFSFALLTMQQAHRGLLIIVMLLNFCIYGAFRYKLALTYSSRMLEGINLGYGIFLSLYGVLFLGILLAVKLVKQGR